MTQGIIRLICLISFLATASLAWTAADSSSALVSTQTLKRQTLASTITGYGMVGIDPLATISINFPVAGQVSRLFVNQGELVSKGAPLVELSLSTSDTLNYSQARSNRDFAQSELARTAHMAEQQLATRSQLEQARKNLTDAEAALAVQQKLGANATATLLRAPFDGIVSQVAVAQGDRLQAGVTVLQLARRDRLNAVIGVEPEERRRVHPGMAVQIYSVFDEHVTITGRIQKVFGMINPQTRLLDVIVALPLQRGVELAPGTRVRGVISLQRTSGFVVPRRAVLKDGQGAYLFVVRTGVAHRVVIQPGIEQNGHIIVTGRLSANDRVVVVGNYELRDGMAVREQQP